MKLRWREEFPSFSKKDAIIVCIHTKFTISTRFLACAFSACSCVWMLYKTHSQIAIFLHISHVHTTPMFCHNLQGKTETVQQCGFTPGGAIMASGAANTSLTMMWRHYQHSYHHDMRSYDVITPLWRHDKHVAYLDVMSSSACHSASSDVIINTSLAVLWRHHQNIANHAVASSSARRRHGTPHASLHRCVNEMYHLHDRVACVSAKCHAYDCKSRVILGEYKRKWLIL